MPYLTLSLLGPLQVQIDGQAVGGFAYNKARALLAYLVVEADRAHQRDTLVGLLWPEMPDAAARTNLRQVLTSLRDTIGSGDPAAPFLITTRDTLQFNPASHYTLDVTRFFALLDACAKHQHRHVSRCPVCAARLEEAVLLYRGDFLAQLPSVDSAPFEEWLVVKREALHQRAVEALAHLAHFHEHWDDAARARQHLARQIELDPWDEAAHAHLMRLLAQDGQRSAALTQYEICRRILAEQFGAEPTLPTKKLHEQIRAGLALEGGTATRSAQLPIGATKLIGRDAEQAELSALLSDPAQRLITIVGPGGIGKTRLALAAAEANAPIFADGVAFVSLAGLTSSEALAVTMLSALEITPEPHTDPAHQLLAELRQHEWLLVLDNFEHLLAGVDLIAQIIQHTRRTILLITSRERLALQSERVFELEGLDYPPEDVSGDGERYSAVQLFIDRARQATRKFQPAQELEAIVRICRLVEGLPLAIELAASTVNVQSCAIIATEIANDLKFLATKFRDVPERHRSMQATFDHSWRLLTVGEQSVFRQLAVFRGGFEMEATQQIAHATREILTALIDKSLLRGDPAGRFELHELLHQFAAEELSRVPAEASAVGSAHSVYYLRLLHEQVDRLSSAQQAKAFATLTAEVDNVRSAWRWTVNHRHWSVIQSSALDLMSWCDYQVYYTDGYQLFAEAIDQLQIGMTPVESLDTERASAEGQVLTGHGYFLWRMGHNQRAQHDLRRGLERLRRADDAVGMADNLIGLGAVSASLGQYEVAFAHFEESAALYARLHDRTGHALAVLQAGIVNRSFGAYETARRQMEHALAEYRQLGDQKMIANSLSHYARLFVLMGQVELAQLPLQESLTISHAIGDRWANSGALVALGQVEYAQEHFEEARRALAESVRELADLNEFERMVDALTWQGLSELALGDHAVADRHLREALRLALQGSLRRCQLGALLGLAEVRVWHEQFDGALELAGCVHDHPATERSTRDRAASLIARLTSPQSEVVQRRAQSRSLDEIIDRVLKEPE
jgi:DNA-binding SARP family transcriptional activator/predicted ATPase